MVSGVPRIVLDAQPSMPQLMRARFERPFPDVHVNDGVVTVRYPSYSLLNWLIYWRRPLSAVTLNASIPWGIEVRGGVSSFEADLSQVSLTSLELRGGVSHLQASLGRPSGTVLIHIVGGVSHTAIQRPRGVPVRIHVQGGISSLTLDEQRFGALSGQPRLETPGYREATSRYDIQIAGGASHVAIE
jgi:hypothetical protein